MKNWKIIAWIILFFPLGIYYMHTYSNWSKKIIYGISGFYGLIVVLSLFTGGLPLLGFLSGVSLLLTSLGLVGKDLLQKSNKKHSLILLVSSILLIGVTASNIEIVDTEVRIASEVEESRVREEEERLEREKAIEQENLVQATEAVEKAEEENTRKNLDAAYELVEKLTSDTSELINRLEVVEESVLASEIIDDFVKELEKAEETPTRTRLERIEKKILELDELDEDFITRMENVREEVEIEEARIVAAEQAITTAESDPTWSNHEAATLAISTIQSSRTALTTRLDSVEEKITAQEEQAKREAEEAEKLAAEKARQAEEERKAQAEAQAASEKAAQEKAEADRKAAEQANSVSSNQSSSSVSPAAAPSTPSGEAALLNFLNTASHGELQSVSYIGPKRATYIIEYRQNNGPFTHPSQVTNVNQIGDGIYSNLRDKFNLN